MNIIENLKERFQLLTEREKIIVTATLIVGLWGGLDKILWTSIKQQQKLITEQLSGFEQQLSAQQQAASNLQSGASKNPNGENETKLAELNAELARMQNQIIQQGGQFVPPKLMAKALNEILSRNHQLNLVKLDSLPATTLRPEKNQFFPVYKHGIELTFSGNFVNTLAYMKSLESLSWYIYWDKIDYQVKKYPLAETTIRAYTLSFEESWLGV